MTQLSSTLDSQPSTLLIRADAARQIGNGHVMRCLALAVEWQARGGRVVFATYADNAAIIKRIEETGAERIAVPAAHPRPDDLPALLSLLNEHRPSWVALDGYHFTPCYQQAVQEAVWKIGGKTLLLDDMAHHPYYHADMLLNQNVYADTLAYPCHENTRLRLGTRYALLRPEFGQWRDWRHSHPETARNVLVTLGGTDPDNVTLKVVQAFDLWQTRNFVVKIVAGPGNPHHAILEQAIADSGRDIELLCAPANMGELMAWADLAVAAAGTTTLELAYMQVPTLSLALADNQKRVADGMAAVGTMQNLGWHDALTPQKLACALRNLAHNLNARRAMGCAGRQLVDGKGTQRVVEDMLRSG